MIYFLYLPWKNYLLSLFLELTLLRSLFSFCEVLAGLWTTENIEVSSAKSFTLGSRLSNKSLIYIYQKNNNNGPRTEPSGTPALNVSHSDSCPFRTTFCCLSNQNDSSKEDNPFTHTFYLKMYGWKVLDISKKHL